MELYVNTLHLYYLLFLLCLHTRFIIFNKIDELNAETKLKRAKLEAEAKTAIAAAEKDSNAFVAKSREFNLRSKRLDIYKALAENPDVVLSDSSEANFNMLLLADNVLATHAKDGQDGGHAGLAAELNMLRLASNAYGLRQDTYIPEGGDASGMVAAGLGRR
jgi:hypothetical protein